MMKHTAILAALLLAACQPSASETLAPQMSVINAPASDDSETLDLTLLPEGFPIIGEIKSSTIPAGCALSKAARHGAHEGTDYNDRYVFTKSADGNYQIGINGELRTLRQSGAADYETNVIRYFKTLEGDEVEIMVSYSDSDDGLSGIVGRVKAWDDDLPLMCGYNRIQITGECDL